MKLLPSHSLAKPKKASRVGSDGPSKYERQWAIAEDPTTPARVLEAFQDDLVSQLQRGKNAKEGPLLLEAIARNPNSAAEALLRLAGDTFPYDRKIRVAIAQNPVWDLILVEDPNFLPRYMNEDLQSQYPDEARGLVHLVQETDFNRYLGGKPRVAQWMYQHVNFRRYHEVAFYPNGMLGIDSTLFVNRKHAESWMPEHKLASFRAFLNEEEKKHQVRGLQKKPTLQKIRTIRSEERGQPKIGGVPPFSLHQKDHVPDPPQLLVLRTVFPDLAQPFEDLWNLYVLEDPSLPLKIPRWDLDTQIDRGISILPGREQRLFAAMCAKQVLPYWEEAMPYDDLPRRAIQIAKEYATGTAPPFALSDLRTAMEEAGERIRREQSSYRKLSFMEDKIRIPAKDAFQAAQSTVLAQDNEAAFWAYRNATQCKLNRLPHRTEKSKVRVLQDQLRLLRQCIEEGDQLVVGQKREAKKPSRVGARTKKSSLQKLAKDPNLSPQQIRDVLYGITQNINLEQARDFAMDVLLGPTIQLLSFEDPTILNDLYGTILRDRIFWHLTFANGEFYEFWLELGWLTACVTGYLVLDDYTKRYGDSPALQAAVLDIHHYLENFLFQYAEKGARLSCDLSPSKASQEQVLALSQDPEQIELYQIRQQYEGIDKYLEPIWGWRKKPAPHRLGGVTKTRRSTVKIGGVAPFAMLPDDKNPSPKQLAILRKLFPDLAEEYDGLWQLYLLENPNLSEQWATVEEPFRLHHPRQQPEMDLVESSLKLLSVRDQNEILLTLAQRVLPVLDETLRKAGFPKNQASRFDLAPAHQLLDLSWKVFRGTSSNVDLFTSLLNTILGIGNVSSGYPRDVRPYAEAIGLAALSAHPVLGGSVDRTVALEAFIKARDQEAIRGDRKILEEGRLAEEYLTLLRRYLTGQDAQVQGRLPRGRRPR